MPPFQSGAGHRRRCSGASSWALQSRSPRGGAWRVAAARECRYWPSGRCRGAGCSSACWMPASNSSSLSSAKPFDLPPPARDLLHHHDFRVPPRRSLARGYRVRLSRDERVPPGLGGELVQLLHQIPLALVLPRQQPVLVKLAGARLTQNPLGKRFLRRRRRRNACSLAAHCRITAYHEGFSLPGRAARPPVFPGAPAATRRAAVANDKAARTLPVLGSMETAPAWTSLHRRLEDNSENRGGFGGTEPAVVNNHLLHDHLACGRHHDLHLRPLRPDRIDSLRHRAPAGQHVVHE